MDQKKETKQFIESMLNKVNSTENSKPNTSKDADVKKIEELTKKIIEGRSLRKDKL